MNFLLKFYRSTLGKKILMALSGLVLIGFVIGHMAGNLKTFGGTTAAGVHHLDEYAEFLRTMGSDLFGHAGILWIFRIILVICLILHVTCAIQLKRLNLAARPRDYSSSRTYHSATLSSRTMFYGGLFLLIFIICHLLHLTFGTLHFNGFVEGKVFANVVNAFQNPIVVVLYLVALAALGLHLYHGTWSVFQTLGIDKPLLNTQLRFLARAIAVLLFIGFSSVPVAILLGILKIA